MLQPDSGEIRLGAEDITALKPDARVKRGLTRTFQINTLFPHLTALESVALAVLEREGAAHNWWRALPRFSAPIDEAHSILKSLHMEAHSDRLTRELAYGQQRLLEIALALATRPRVLLLDEPAAGVPTAEAHILLEVVESLPLDIAMLIIEHDMDVVFRFAREITVLVAGAVFARGAPSAIAADERVREVYLGHGRHD
jgi:branched-chain amino acid transport system ATP-binding protein